MHKAENFKNAATRYDGGFTLLELSIFFLIASALVMATFKGKDLIEAYRVQAVIKEYQEHLTAFRAFKAKYNYMPGDFPTASRYWPDLANSSYPAFSGDGDGNGIIDNDGFKGLGLGWITQYYEGALAWAHLSKEGLISGNYMGPFPKCFSADGHCSEEGGIFAANRNTGFMVRSGQEAPESSMATHRPTCENQIKSGPLTGNEGEGLGSACQGRPLWISRTIQFTDSSSARASWKQPFMAFNIINDFRYYGENRSNTFYSTRCEAALALDNKMDDGKPYTGKFTSHNGDGFCVVCESPTSGCTRANSDPANWRYVYTSEAGFERETILNFEIEASE